MSGNKRVSLVTCLILFCSIALAPRFRELGAEPTQAALKNKMSAEIDLPIPWENQSLILISLSTVTSGGVVIGRTAVYDDTRTARPADVAVLYNAANGPVAIAWVDRFGIQRIGIDSGVVRQTGDLDGVFVFSCGANCFS